MVSEASVIRKAAMWNVWKVLEGESHGPRSCSWQADEQCAFWRNNSSYGIGPWKKQTAWPCETKWPWVQDYSSWTESCYIHEVIRPNRPPNNSWRKRSGTSGIEHSRLHNRSPLSHRHTPIIAASTPLPQLTPGRCRGLLTTNWRRIKNRKLAYEWIDLVFVWKLNGWMLMTGAGQCLSDLALKTTGTREGPPSEQSSARSYGHSLCGREGVWG